MMEHSLPISKPMRQEGLTSPSGGIPHVLPVSTSAFPCPLPIGEHKQRHPKRRLI
jgi:hypothetical protein